MRNETNLQERVLLLNFKLVGSEKLKTTSGLLWAKTVVVTLEQPEDVLDNDSLQIDLLLVVEVLSLELNLKRRKERFEDHETQGRGDMRAYSSHVHIGV